MKITNWWNTYTYNIKRTHRHKVAYAIDEYQQYGYNTVDSITHDTDKIVAYAFGLPHKLVRRFHRKISEHHTENNTKKNLKSMFLDIHCSQDKTDKQLPFRDYFYSSEDLQRVKGFKQYVEERNFGEAYPISQLTKEVDKVTSSVWQTIKFGINTIKRMKY